jgi:hypothetical protein
LELVHWLLVELPTLFFDGHPAQVPAVQPPTPLQTLVRVDLLAPSALGVSPGIMVEMELQRVEMERLLLQILARAAAAVAVEQQTVIQMVASAALVAPDLLL